MPTSPPTNGNSNNNNTDDNRPGLIANKSHRGQHHHHHEQNYGNAAALPRRRRSSSMVLLDVIPVISHEFVLCEIPKEDLMTTYDNIQSNNKSFRSLDVKSRNYARAVSQRNLTNFPEEDLGEESEVTDEEGSTKGDGRGCCSLWKSFEEQDPTAKGYSVLGACRGTILMSNVFLSSSLIYLASLEAGCVDLETEELIDDCDGKAKGFKPTSLITNISVVSGLLAAFFVPVLGAVIDYTRYRRHVGIITAVLVTIIQGLQIATVEETWFVMACLQAVVGFLFFVQIMATFAYLPEMARNVGGSTMNHFTKWFTFLQFLTQLIFLIVIIVPGIIFNIDTIQTAQLGQAVSTTFILGGFIYAWGYILPNRPAARELPEGHTLWLEGFRQNYRTVGIIRQHYKKGLKWFMLTNAVAEAGVSALLPVGVTFLTEEVKFGALEIGITFAISLLTSLPGSFIGAKITSRTDPRISWMYCLLYFVIVTLGGTFALVEERSYLGYVWGGLWGVGLGWFYPVGNLTFSLCLPRGYENEMTGMFVYTGQILAWLPPLVFTFIIELGANTRFGFLSLFLFQAIGIGLLYCMSPWEEVLEESGKVIKPEETTSSSASPGMDITTPDNDDDDDEETGSRTNDNQIGEASGQNSIEQSETARKAGDNLVNAPLAPVPNHPSKRPDSEDEANWRHSRTPPRISTQGE